MALSVRPLDADDLPAAHDLYTVLAVGRVPHCHPVQPALFAQVLSASPVRRDGDGRLDEAAVLVADDDGLTGFVHVAREAVLRDGDAPRGIVRFLAYPRGRRDAGEVLVDAAELWLRERGLGRCHVMAQAWRYPFYAYDHAYLSDHLDHVMALWLRRGYRRAEGEVFLDWPDMDPVVPAPPASLSFDLAVEEVDGHGRLPGVRVKAMRTQQPLGVCYLRSAGDFSPVEAAQQTAFCDWLGVHDEFQGVGLGRYLLAAALHEARQRGYRHGAISTAFDNHRAFLFYANHGFRVVDWTYELVRELD
jgi:GNAT superfamily N-acetyltransferase